MKDAIGNGLFPVQCFILHVLYVRPVGSAASPLPGRSPQLGRWV